VLLSNLKRLSNLTAILVAAPLLCLPAAVQVNGTCEVGTCATPGTLNSGDSVPSTPFSFVFTFADTDKYFVNGDYSASYTGGATHIAFTANANYIGNSTNTTSGHDTLTIDLLQDYNFTTGSPDGTYHSHAKLNVPGSAAAGSFAEAQVFYDGQSTGLMGPYSGPGTKDFFTSKTLSGLTNPIDVDFQYVFNFAAGTTAIPEPTEAGLFALGLIGLAIPAVLRRRRNRAAEAR